jgi:hypothetical protein
MLEGCARAVGQKRRQFATSLVVLGCVLSLPFVVNAAQELALTLDETVRRADAIVVGTVTNRQSRWGDSSRRFMVTDYTLAIEKILYPSEQGDPIGDTVVVTYWGGTIGDETQSISDLRVPVVGERLMMMLRPDWRRTLEFSPVVGLNQGLFKLAGAAAGAGNRTEPVVVDAGGQQLVMTSGGSVERQEAATSSRGSVSLEAFESWLKSNISRIKSTPSTIPPAALQDAGQRMDLFAKMPSPEIRLQNSREAGERRRLPFEPDDAAASAPAMPLYSTLAAFDPPAMTSPLRSEYVTLGPKPNLPIVVNNLPNSFSPWSPEDEYQMSKWNYYAHDVFHVYTNPTSTFGWGDGVFDLDGWVDSATLQSVYGSPWGATTIGVTFTRSIGGTIIEADIALNPAYTFTLDDEGVYDGGSAQGFRLVMLHELGHMLGLDHNFGGMSAMNYFPSVFRAFTMPYMDDAAGIRALYPGNSVSRTDLGVYLYYASGAQSVTDATYPASVVAGSSLTVNNYTVENVGTTSIGTPTIEWYLTSARNFDSAYYHLGDASYSPALGVFTYYTPSTVGRTFTVPSSVPAGSYYLAAFIRSDGGTGQGSFAFSNNLAFSRKRIAVTQPPPATPVLVSPANNATNVTRTPTLDWNSSAGATSYDLYLGTSTTPAFYVNTSATNYSVGTLALGTKYYWYVVARNSAGTSSPSSTFNFTTVSLATPILLSPANNATAVSRKPILSWTAIAGATSYDVYFGTAAQPAFYANTAGTALKPSPLSAGTTFRWFVVARSASGVSSPSSTFSFTTTTAPSLVHLVFRNSQTGDVAAWVMNGVTLVQATMISSGLSLAWRIDAVGDLDGDGNTDVVFRNTQTGDVAAWLMNGVAIKQSAIIAPAVPLAWQITRAGDLNGDGKADLVFRNTQSGDVGGWLMNGLSLSQSGIISAGLSLVWRIDGMGDLNGDGKSDLVFRNTQSGDVAGWLMNGLTLSQGAIIVSALSGAWRIDGMGDLNGDGKSDILFRNTQSGDVAGWLMNGLSLSQSGMIFSGVSLGWQITAIGDLNSDGKADILFRSESGNVAGWLMDGLTLSQSATIYPGLSLLWQIVGFGDLDG